MASASRKASAITLSTLLLGGTVAAFLPAYFAGRQIRAFCADLTPGMPIAEVQSRAEAKGYRFEHTDGGIGTVEHPQSLGRACCDVDFDEAGRLTRRSADN